MPSVCAESPLVACGGAFNNEHLYALLQDVVPTGAACLRFWAGIAVSRF
jgi:hypothetical protein